MSPTKRQQDALRYIRGYQAAKGCGPIMQEIADGLGLAAKSGVFRLLKGLEERGLIERFLIIGEPGRWRMLDRAASREFEVLTDIAIPRSPTGEPLYFVSVP